MRTAQIARKTNETDIQLSLNLDGRGESAIESGVGFLDHMLTLLSRLPVPAHGRGPDFMRRGPVRPGRVL